MIDVSKISGLTSDSRAVKGGYLFAALPGAKMDGRDFIGDALAKGAAAILAPKDTDDIEGAELIRSESPRQDFAFIASAFYNNQPATCVAVTGTNGKTSVVSFTEQLWQALGYNATSLGTLKGSLTTPDPVALHEKLSAEAKSGITHLALEASSHGLDQYRLDGVRLTAAGFTNLSRDHMDYHGDMDNYFKAKARLFEEVLPNGGVAILNADEDSFEALQSICDERGINTITYGRRGKDLHVIKITPTPHGQNIDLAVFGQEKSISFPLVGEFQAMNALCALGLVLAQDSDHKSEYLKALESLKGAHGRLEFVAGHPKGGVYVDYAHTPDALENVLNALRPHTENKLVCVFGCGGDRDKGKRPQMGEIATTLADTVIVTDDNPRSEDPATIRAEILKAAPDAIEISDRHAAIQTAIDALEQGDVLVIAGKGHETGQIFADRTDPFDDVREAEKAIQTLKSKG